MSSDSVCRGCGRPVDAGTTLCTACADAPPAAPARDDAPTIARPAPSFSLPGLTFRAPIGEGGMGSVHLAEEIALGRRVAVKMIAERYAADEGVKTRFLREARAMATIEHPHVVRIYSYGEAAGTAYLTMEYVDGEDLATRLRRVGRLGVDETIRLAHQIVEGLEAGWEHRIVHRDIKPSNILIDRRGNARVADFGLAKPIETGGDPSLTQSGYLLGTPQYISPEQAQGKSVDFRSDLYSLGVMLHHLLMGKHPFEASTPVALVAKHLSEPLPPLERERPEVPIELARLIDWMARKNPGERPSSYAEVRERLAAMIASTPPTPVPTVKVPVASWSRGEQLKLAAALLVVAALAVFYAIQFGRGDTAPKDDAAAFEPADPRFALAVAPFYGPDEDSAKEGRVMAALVERAVEKRLGAKNVRIFGIDVTEKPVRDHDAARALGAKLAADAVIWGEALSYRDETEITPQVTILTGKKKAQESDPGERGPMGAADPLSQLEEAPVQPVTLESEAPNQIAMRKMSAAGLGDVALFLAGVHALNKLEKPEKALELFREAPPSEENLRYQVQALVAAGREDEAIPLLEELSRDHSDVSTSAQLGDLYAAAGRLKEAAAAYRAAAESGEAWATTRGFWHAGRLYLKEMYAGPGGPKNS
ncbi:MAG TPA: serine/threonine-protein kinase, partial [Thermoanaerobaculia bacterium]